MLADKIFEQAFSELKKIKWPEISTGFFDNSGINKTFMLEDLARSGLSPFHLGAHAPTLPMLNSGDSAKEACYIIPYFDLEGQPILSSDGYPVFYRQRMKLPEFSKESRYTQPSSKQLIKYNLPGFLPYIHPLTRKLKGERVYCAEGEKKTVSVLRYLGQPTFGIGGCQMWRDPNGSGGIHPWIRDLLEKSGANTVTIIPDGDLFRYDICNAYGTFAHVLREQGYEVEIIQTPGKIDDLFVGWGADAAAEFDKLTRVTPDELVQSPAMLAKKYYLAYRETKDGVTVPHQNTSNLTILLENHPGFDKIWLNLDTNKINVGEQEMIPQRTEVEITNYFQHNLGFDKVNTNQIWTCVAAIARKNSASPFFDWIREQVWDGVPRLETWLNRLWGVKQDELSAELGSKFLVGACARLDKPGTKVDWIMITIGPQGTGKSSMPKVLFQGNSSIMYGESTDKDFHMKLHSSLVTGFDEMDSFGKREMSFLKAMISSEQDTFRPPYGRTTEVFKRRFMLYGSGNRNDFLQYDPSGYRRYPTVMVTKKLEFDLLNKELSQMWAEAWALYTKGVDVSQIFSWKDENAEEFVIISSLEEQMILALEKHKEKKFIMTELMMWMGLNTNSLNSNVTRELSGFLRKLGYEQKRARTETGPRRVWFKP